MKTFRSKYPKTWALLHGLKWFVVFVLGMATAAAIGLRAMEFLIYCHGPGRC